jgi:colicin import membrane protein
MRIRRFALALLAILPAWAGAAGDADEDVQRQHIARERAEAVARYAEREAVCRERFIVTACIDTARAERRDALDRLQRQDEALDGQERRRRAAARLAAIREKTEALERPRAPRAADPLTGVGGAASKPDVASAAGGQAASGAEGRASPGSSNTSEAAARQRDAAFRRRADDAAVRRRDARAESEQRRAAVRDAAAARAAAAHQRRQEVLEAERQRASGAASRKPLAPLPARPAIPPASKP